MWADCGRLRLLARSSLPPSVAGTCHPAYDQLISCQSVKSFCSKPRRLEADLRCPMVRGGVLHKGGIKVHLGESSDRYLGMVRQAGLALYSSYSTSSWFLALSIATSIFGTLQGCSSVGSHLQLRCSYSTKIVNTLAAT